MACVNTSDVCAGIVGEIDEGGDGYYIWTHKKFDIGYNGKQIVDVNLTSESKVKLEPNIKISFSYEVSRISISVSLCIAHQAVYFASQILMTVLLSLIVHYCMNKIHDQKDHAGGGGGGDGKKKCAKITNMVHLFPRWLSAFCFSFVCLYFTDKKLN